MSQTVDQQMVFIRDHSMREIAENRIGAAFTGDVDQGVPDWMVDMVASGDKDGYQSEAQTTLYFNVRDRLKEIKVPTTVIHGEQHPAVPVAEGEALAEAIDGATWHVLPGEGHYAIVQVPEQINPLFAGGLGIPENSSPSGNAPTDPD